MPVEMQKSLSLTKLFSPVLARKTAPTDPSPLPHRYTPLARTPRRVPILDEDFDIGPDPRAPRLSLPLGELERDSDDEAPPRLSSAAFAYSSEDEEPGKPELTGLVSDDADVTAHSVEGGRRARVGRKSLATERFAELAAELRGLAPPAVGDLSELPDDGMGNTTELIMDVDGESFFVCVAAASNYSQITDTL